MRIQKYRLFLLSFVTASFVFLTGFEQSGANDALAPAEKQAVLNEVKEDQAKAPKSLVKSKQKNTKNKRKGNSAFAAKNSAVEESELHKPLDLSMPFNTSESAALTIEQKKAVQKESLNIFSSEKDKKLRPLDLDGQMLMSQEPEGDKRKSFDGAGIVINLKR